MSRNFELLQRIGMEHVAVPFSNPFTTPLSTAAAAAVPVQEPRGSRLNVKPGIPQSEVSKLVQRLFLKNDASEEKVRAVLFTSIDSADGTTSICSVAADALASQTASSICAVDAREHARGTALHDCWDVENVSGLRDALIGTEPINGFCTPIATNLWLLSAGSHVNGMDRLRRAEGLKSRIRELREKFEYVLIDAPPLAESSDPFLFGPAVDGVVLILKANSTRKETTRRVVADFEAAGVRVLGVVLNQRRFPIPAALYPLL